MAYQDYQSEAGGSAARPAVDARVLWAGGVAAAVVAALAYVVGVLIARTVFNIPILAPTSAGALGDGSTWGLAVAAFVAGLLATALMHLLLVATPRPYTFFSWIVGLLTVVVTVLPFSQEAPLSAKVTTAIINLMVGALIGSLVSGVAVRALRVRPQPPGYATPGGGAGYTAPTGYESSGNAGPAQAAPPHAGYVRPNPRTSPPPRYPYDDHTA